MKKGDTHEIIADGDPTRDIRLLMDADNNIDLIMKDGKIYKNELQNHVKSSRTRN